MKECTLQEAIELCRENGGRFRYKPDGVWWTIEKDVFVHESLGKIPFTILPWYYKEPWIYEPPKQSAFQEWNKKQGCQCAPCVGLRKAGYNQAIDTVVKKLKPLYASNIEKLKEE